jgi:hypothetical protein
MLDPFLVQLATDRLLAEVTALLEPSRRPG